MPKERLTLEDLYDAHYEQEIFKVRIANSEGKSVEMSLSDQAAGEIIENLHLMDELEVHGYKDDFYYVIDFTKKDG